MNHWQWESFSSIVTATRFEVADQGPLYGPVKRFAINRDKHLQLILESVSDGDSKTNARARQAGEVYIATDDVVFKDDFGSVLTANGVIPRSYKKSLDGGMNDGFTEELSSINSLYWRSAANLEQSYVIDWVENMPNGVLWPHSYNSGTKGERFRKMSGAEKEVVFTAPISTQSFGRSFAHIVVDGIDVFVGTSQAKCNGVSNPGFVLYAGEIGDDVRAKIRDCLAFSLGSFLIYLGCTGFTEAGDPVSFCAKSAHALADEAKRLSNLQPCPLGTKYESEVDPRLLGRLVSSLYDVYEDFGLQSILWRYWHAIAAPAHMAAAHFGAAIEALQRTYIDVRGTVRHTKIVANDFIWRGVFREIQARIDAADLSDDEKTILKRKVEGLNLLPQSLAMDRFFESLKLNRSGLDKWVWSNRNRAAHGGSLSNDGIDLIRQNKVLHLTLNRLLIAISKGGEHYYDYYTLGRPTRRVVDAIADDRPAPN